MMMVPEAVIQQILHIRQKTGHGARRIAEQLGLTRHYVDKVISGRHVKKPAVPKLCRRYKFELGGIVWKDWSATTEDKIPANQRFCRQCGGRQSVWSQEEQEPQCFACWQVMIQKLRRVRQRRAHADAQAGNRPLLRS